VVGFVTLALWLAIAPGASALGWAVQQTPNPAGGMSSKPDGVSCASLSSCTAVGFSTNRTGAAATLAERWKGTSWSIQRTPNPAGATSSSLLGVSCASPRSCTAVGFWYYISLPSSEVMLAERWNASSWSVQRTPNPAGATYGQFAGVSCPSLRFCTAVGFFTDRAGTLSALAERWNRNSWSIQRTPNPIDGALVGVSCPSTTACTALASNAAATLAERWNGTSWMIQPTPNPADAISSQLDGVSCASPRSCAAVGTFTNLAGTNMTLAERYS